MSTPSDFNIPPPPTRQEGETVKRGRGRPRKNPELTASVPAPDASPYTSNQFGIGTIPNREVPQREVDTRAALSRTPQEKLTRRHHADENPYNLPQRVIDDAAARGMSLEWKRQTVFGQPDPRHMVNLRENHWSPVEAARYPEITGKNEGLIELSGMVLMERPAYLTQEATEEYYEKAQSQVKAQEANIAGTPRGTLTREHATARPKIRHSAEPLTVPRD